MTSTTIARNNSADQQDALRARLRKGQQWITQVWSKVLAADDEPTQQDIDDLNIGLDLWGEIEGQMRDAGFKGCVIGAAGCDPDCPVRCYHCAALAQANRATAPSGNVIICTRDAPKRRNRKPDQEQPSLFNVLGRKH